MKISPSSYSLVCFAAALVDAGAAGAADLVKGYTLGPITQHFGAPDGSSGVAIGPAHFLSVSDEENAFRLYSTEDGKKTSPLTVGPVDFNEWVKAPHKEKHPSEFQECDLEGAARIGERIYWIGSHGRNGKGEVCPERCVLFAAEVSGSGEDTMLTLVGGGPYRQLLEDLRGIKDPGVAALFDKAIGGPDTDPALAPKMEGALNIESLCADGGTLLIGFRNPIAAGGALVVPLLNPAALFEPGARAKLGDPVTLALDGLGIRDMARWRGGFLVIAGKIGDPFETNAGPSALYLWNRESKTLARLDVSLDDLNPEAAVLFPGTEGNGCDRLLLLSDDGKSKINDTPKGKPPQPQQSFRSVWLLPPP